MYSVIIPVYNVELYIERCINSVLKQTYKQFELILVDDGSTDQSKKRCYDAMKRDNRIKVISQDNKGASVARNNGVKSAMGDYIIFLDGDDFWLYDNVLAQIDQRIRIKNPDVLILNYAKVVNSKIQNPYFSKVSMPIKYNEKAGFKYVYDNDLWTSSAWNKVIKREMFNKFNLNFIEGITAEDIEWCARVLKNTKFLDYMDIVAVGYVQRTGSVTSNVTEKKIYSLEKSVSEVKRLSEGAVGIKKCIFQRFLAYQTVVLLINLSGANDEIKKEFSKKKWVKELLAYLKYANNKKVKLLGKMTRFLPLEVLINMIGLMRKFGKARR